MIRRAGGGRLSAQVRKEQEDVNPMESTSNLADVMLVLAVGMMLAVVINWNVDINKNVTKKIENPKTVNSDQIRDEGEQQNLVEKGTVYYDPDKDQYYVRVE